MPTGKKTWQSEDILEKKKFYKNTFSVANPNENKQHSQGIQVSSNKNLYPSNVPLDTVFPNIQGDNCLKKYCKLSVGNLRNHPKLHHSLHISTHRHQ